MLFGPMPSQAALLIALAFLLAPFALHAEVYKWVDADGRTHFSDRPAPGAASERVHIQTPPVLGDEAAITESATEVIEPGSGDKLARKPVDIVMYATKSCGYCSKARALFSERGVAWREVDIESSEQANQEFKQRGGKGVPLTFINGQAIRGFNEDKLRSALSQHGY